MVWRRLVRAFSWGVVLKYLSSRVRVAAVSAAASARLPPPPHPSPRGSLRGRSPASRHSYCPPTMRSTATGPISIASRFRPLARPVPRVMYAFAATRGFGTTYLYHRQIPVSRLIPVSRADTSIGLLYSLYFGP